MALFLGVIAGALNLGAYFYMRRLENELRRKGVLPQWGILYMRDYKFCMWGDRIFLTIIDFAILYVLVQGWPLSVIAVSTSIAIAVLWTGIWDVVWLRESHRPDSFYPRAGERSKLGKIHLWYFFIQYAIGFMGLWMIGYMVAGFRPWSWIAVVGLVAAGAYYVTLALDLIQGKFKRPAVPHG